MRLVQSAPVQGCFLPVAPLQLAALQALVQQPDEERTALPPARL